MKMEKLTLRMASAFMTGLMVVQTGEAQANNFSKISDNIVNSLQNIPNLVSTTSYLGGLGLSVLGVVKLKGHVDNPGSVALKDGLVRLGAGGGLLALPIVLDAMATTIGTGGTVKQSTLPPVTP